MEKLNKFKSMKVLVTLWAIGLLTYIVVTNKTDFTQVAMILATAPMTYCVVNVKQKEIFNKLVDAGDK